MLPAQEGAEAGRQDGAGAAGEDAKVEDGKEKEAAGEAVAVAEARGQSRQRLQRGRQKRRRRSQKQKRARITIKPPLCKRSALPLVGLPKPLLDTLLASTLFRATCPVAPVALLAATERFLDSGLANWGTNHPARTM